MAGELRSCGMMRTCLRMACNRIPSSQVCTLDSGFLAGATVLTMMGGARSLRYRTEGLTLMCDVTLPGTSARHVHMTEVPRQQRLLVADLPLTRKVFE